MALPLKDFRVQLNEAVLAALEAEGIAFDRTMESVAREILSEWARRKHRAYTVYARRVLANGNQMELDGFGLEDAGTQRSRARGTR